MLEIGMSFSLLEVKNPVKFRYFSEIFTFLNFGLCFAMLTENQLF